MHERDDDEQVGEILSRRAAVRLLSAGGAASLLSWAGVLAAGRNPLPPQAGPPAPGCIVRPEMTEGPYFVDKQLNRPDIRDGRPGQVLNLALTVVDATGGQCRPVPGATVDVWQCDARGVYSAVSDRSQGLDSSAEKFLRGYQTTDPDGVVRFTTIYPGWYSGRTVHLHFKIRAQAPAGAYEFTSQWYFDETLNERILAGPDYSRPGRRDTMNSTDMIYRNGGDQLLLAASPSGDALTTGYLLGLDLSNAAVGRADGGAGGPGGRGRGGRGRRGGGG